MKNASAEHLQKQIYMFVSARLVEGMPPTIREIGQAVGITSTGHIVHHLHMLEKQGLIERQKGKSRSIRLTRPTGIPFLGAIAAGIPLDILPETATLGEWLPGDLRSPADNVFALLVRGQSMIDDHICDGDCIVVRQQETYQNGDIVVATNLHNGLHGSATLKRLHVEHDQVRLQPANAEMKPLVIPKDEWERAWTIQGKVVAILRRYFT